MEELIADLIQIQENKQNEIKAVHFILKYHVVLFSLKYFI